MRQGKARQVSQQSAVSQSVLLSLALVPELITTHHTEPNPLSQAEPLNQPYHNAHSRL